MATATKITFEDYLKLPSREGTIYELDEGELLMEPSPALRHNLIRQRIAAQLTQFVRAHRLGVVVEEMDFRLGADTVRNPDVAFITSNHLKKIDPDRSPVDGAPALAVEVISPSNPAQDTLKKAHQYLNAGSQAVWLVYPSLRMVQIHTLAGIHDVKEPDSIREKKLFSGLEFSLSLAAIFDDDLQN